MGNLHKYSNILHEEKRTTIWFLWLFYGIYVGYEIVFFYILPRFLGDIVPADTINTNSYLILYFLLFGLLIVAYYYMKNNNPSPIKYIYFISFTLINLVIELNYYLSNDITYVNGNIIEIVIVLFAPIFVNKKFFYLVFFGTCFKFILIGLALKQIVVIIPLLILLVLSIVSFIVLSRFLGYVSAFKSSYDNQMEGLVKGVIATLELKDPYTRGHSERVAGYAMLLVKATGEYKTEDLKPFYYACLLHDIGKINIPDAILSKPGELTKPEFDKIKTHPTVGAEALQEVEGVADYIDVIRHHHERWDGKGYPSGLKGNETSFFARLTSIADAFDAMTSSRSYRVALPLEEAYKNILDGKGTQFDPDLVNTFIKVFPKWVDYHKNYHELHKK